jgi:SAM-dependent methyltransferase
VSEINPKQLAVSSERALYDRIGRQYRQTRQQDPRLAAAIWKALGDSKSVVNVGAGTGAYEPSDRPVTAVEPSSVMIAQRPPASAPTVQAAAEALPFPDNFFDASMAIFSDHHWSNRRLGLQEMRRVARERVVIFQWDASYIDAFWLTRDYLPGFRRLAGGGMTAEDIGACIGATRIETFPIPHDCRDGFLMAFWRRPEAYLNASIRAGISVFPLLPAADVSDFAIKLERDLRSGDWHRRNADLLELDQLDLGCRLVIADCGRKRRL